MVPPFAVFSCAHTLPPGRRGGNFEVHGNEKLFRYSSFTPASFTTRRHSSISFVETAEQLQSDGVSPAGSTPGEFLAAITKEIELWRRVVNDAGVKLE